MPNDSVYNILPAQAMLTEREFSVTKCVNLFESGAENIYLVDDQGHYRWRAVRKINFRLARAERGNWVIPTEAVAPVVFDLPISEKTKEQLNQVCSPVLDRDINMVELLIINSNGKAAALARMASSAPESLDWDKLPEACLDMKKNERLAKKIYISSLENPLLAQFAKYWRGRLEMELLSEENWQKVLFGQSDGILLYANDIFPNCPKISIEELYSRLHHIQTERMPPFGEAIQGIISRLDSLQKDISSLQKLSGLTQLLPKAAYTDAARKNDTERFLADYRAMVKNGESFKKDVKALLGGLEPESRSAICLILGRLMVLDKGEQIHYTEKEKRMVEDQRRNYRPQIRQIAPGIFSCYGHVLPVNHFESVVFHYEHGLGELRHLERLNGKSVLDAGGYVGDSALIIRKYVKEGTIYSFEAKAENCERIPLTAAWNGLHDVVPVNKALGEREGEISFYVSKSPGMSETCSSVVIDGCCLHEGEIVERKVPCTTVDAFVRENKLEVGLIKVDVEGAEQMLLRGAEQTLREQRPTLCIAIYHNMDDFMHIKPWLENLGLGYHFRIFRPVLEHSFMFETVLLAEID